MNKPFYGAASIPKADRPNMVSHQDVPGPGSYDTNKEKKNNDLPKWTLKKRIDQGSCFQNLSVTPGPGRYNSEEGFKKQKEQIISTKGQKYKSYFQKSYPHSPINLPGALNLKAGYSFGYRDSPKQNQQSPGPVYHLSQIEKNKRKTKNESFMNGFGSDKKNKIKNEQTPGPGSFNHELKDSWVNKSCQSWTFGSSSRGNFLPSTNIGPGEYNPKLNSTAGRIFKLRGRNQVKQYETSALGPGAYNIPDTKTKLGTKFNTPKIISEYQNQSSNKQQENISPCTYNPPRYLEQPSERGYSLGMKIQQKNISASEQPGPGAYQIAATVSKGHGGYMGRKVQIKKKQNFSMDNFYRYDPNINSIARQSPKFSFPQSKRNDKENYFQSSQKFYTIENKSMGHSYSMGTAKRFNQLKKNSILFKQRMTDFSTIGQMPSYLKKSSRRS